jgi:hypothetical protein
MQAERLIKRQEALFKMGVLYDNGFFTLEDIKYEMAVVKEGDDDVFQIVLDRFAERYDINQKAEQKRIEEKERLQRELEEKEKQMKLDQERIDRENRELEEKKLLMETERKSRVIERINATGWIVATSAIVHPLDRSQQQSLEILAELDESRVDAFISTMTDLNKQIVDQDAKRRSEEVAKSIEEANKKRLEKEEADRREAEEKERQRLVDATDSEKWKDFISQVNTLRLPEVSGRHFTKKLETAKSKLAEIINL